MRDLEFEMLVDVADVCNVFKSRISFCNGDNFFILSFVIAHHEHTNRSYVECASREQRIACQHHNIEGVSITTERLRKKTIIKRIKHWAKQNAIKLDHLQFRIKFVFILAAAWNFDDSRAQFW